MDDLKITEMISAEGEQVPFTQTLYPEGNVEDWLLKVENVMRESLRQILSDYKTVKWMHFFVFCVPDGFSGVIHRRF